MLKVASDLRKLLRTDGEALASLASGDVSTVEALVSLDVCDVSGTADVYVGNPWVPDYSGDPIGASRWSAGNDVFRTSMDSDDPEEWERVVTLLGIVPGSVRPTFVPPAETVTSEVSDFLSDSAIGSVSP